MRCLMFILSLGGCLSLSTGCRQCGQGNGWFTSRTRHDQQPCQLVGSGKPLAEGCYDPVTGQPVPCPPGPGMVVPGGPVPLSAPTLPNELPPPEMIPRPGVPIPSAPPAPAPAPSDGLTGNLKTAPVKNK
jgi:hypothetical protein